MTEKLSTDERKEWARTLYTRQDFTEKEIAVTVDVDEATVRKWAKDDAWAGVRRSLLTAKEAQLNLLYTGLEKLDKKVKNEADISVKDLDQVLKFSNAIRNLELEVPIPQIIEVGELFILWLKERNRPLARQVVQEYNAFIAEQEAA
jgi:Putative ATPase subunit of terminase (gpP-like)